MTSCTHQALRSWSSWVSYPYSWVHPIRMSSNKHRVLIGRLN